MAVDSCSWIVAVGAGCIFLNSIALGNCVVTHLYDGCIDGSNHQLVNSGANNLALAWGPAIGARIFPYRQAAPLGALFAFVGAVLFGDRSAPIFAGYLNKNWAVAQDLPELTLYSMMWWPLVLLLWQVAALRWQVPIVPYLGYGAHDGSLT